VRADLAIGPGGGADLVVDPIKSGKELFVAIWIAIFRVRTRKKRFPTVTPDYIGEPDRFRWANRSFGVFHVAFQIATLAWEPLRQHTGVRSCILNNDKELPRNSCPDPHLPLFWLRSVRRSEVALPEATEDFKRVAATHYSLTQLLANCSGS
jgi:hypothetical protein